MRFFGRADGNKWKDHLTADEPIRRARLDISAVEFDLSAEFLQPLEVQINGSRADGATARLRDPRLTAARNNRPQDKHAGPHLPDEIVRRRRVRNIRGVEMRDPAFIRTVAAVYFDGDAVMLQQTRQSRDIRQTRQVFQRQRLVSQQGSGHQRQRCILRTRNRYLPHQTLTASNTDARHAAALRRTCRPVGRTVVSGCHGISFGCCICLPPPLPYLNNAAISRRSGKRRDYIDFRTTNLRHEVLEFTHSDIRVDHSSPSVRFGIRTIQINGRTMTLATV